MCMAKFKCNICGNLVHWKKWTHARWKHIGKILKGQPSESKAQATRNIMYGFESNLIKAFKYEFYKWDWDEKIHPLILIPKSN